MLGLQNLCRLMKQAILKAIRTKAFKPKINYVRGVKPAPNLLAGVKSVECATWKISIPKTPVYLNIYEYFGDYF